MVAARTLRLAMASTFREPKGPCRRQGPLIRSSNRLLVRLPAQEGWNFKLFVPLVIRKQIVSRVLRRLLRTRWLRRYRLAYHGLTAGARRGRLTCQRVETWFVLFLAAEETEKAALRFRSISTRRLGTRDRCGTNCSDHLNRFLFTLGTFAAKDHRF